MSASIAPEEIVPEKDRDDLFKQIRPINKNKMCIDCEKKNPTWASIYLGIHLCIDCAGKHRQYGVMYSFVKSTNLDVWNRKQLLFMGKGGNQKFLDHLVKCGAISDVQKHIDYRSPIVQKYKAILTAEVENELIGVKSPAPKETQHSSLNIEEDFSTGKEKPSMPKQIPNATGVEPEEKRRKKKQKKKVGNKITLDFDAIDFDDGIPIEEKQKIVKAYESGIKTEEQTIKTAAEENCGTSEDQNKDTSNIGSQEPPKQLTEEESKQKLQEIKGQKNVQSICSESFKNTAIDQKTMKNNLDKFSGAQSISSSAFFKQQTKSQVSMEKVKDFVSDAGGRFYGKLSSYWRRN